MADLGMPSYTGTRHINGRWSHTWHDGTVLPVIRGGDGTADDDGDQDEDDTPDDDEPEDEPDKGEAPVKKANAEAKRRRLQAKEQRQRADLLQAELDLSHALTDEGLSSKKIKRALKCVDWDVATDTDEAVEYLRDEYPEMFAGAKETQQLPSTGAAHNSQKGKGKGKTRQQLEAKYAALRR